MQEQLIENLIQKVFFNQNVELKQTHISWIIITDEYVYKIKKAVNFGFLNFETLANRKQFCEQEVQLNSNMGAQFYLGVVAISGDCIDPKLENDSAPIEYAVKMKKFDSEQEFSFLESTNKLTEDNILQLIEKIAKWHIKAPVVDLNTELGTPESIHHAVSDNFELILANQTDKSIVDDVNFIKSWADSTYAKQKKLLQQRRDIDQKIKSCHGDLHLANIVIYNQEVTPFDCIEFNLEFRYIDVINDLAFLLMDLDAKNRLAFSNIALNRYLELTGDYTALPLLNYYKSYRAMVRAKVNLLQMLQAKDELNKSSARAEFLKYIKLAKSYISKPNNILLIMSGVTGSGKSTCANELVKNLGAVHLSSDIERKRLFGLTELESSYSKLKANIYTPQANKITYEKLAQLTNLVLSNNFTALVDATFLKQEHRAMFLQIAKNLELSAYILGFKFNKKTLKARVNERLLNKNAISEANLEVLEHQLKAFEDFSETENNICIVFNETNCFSIDKTLEFINSKT